MTPHVVPSAKRAVPSPRPSPRLPYDDADTTEQMRADSARVAARVARPAPSLLYADFPREVAKPELTVSEAAVRLAAQLHLHLD